jgi:taurine dioxygenase
MTLSDTAASEQFAALSLEPFGAEVHGFDARRADRAQADALKHALATHGVVVLRDQPADDEAFVGFLKRLGTLTFTQGETPAHSQPMLNVVSNVGRSKPPRSVFHTDTSYISTPPAFTALRAVALPASGGETVFSNQYRAFETLPRGVKTQFAEAKVLHVMSGLASTGSQESQSWHPLFKRHPLSQRVALYLSTPERCQAISGLAAGQAARVIALLYRHSIRESRLYRHRWRPGDWLIWDNRCTLHRGDHAAVVGDRVFHRGLVLP